MKTSTTIYPISSRPLLLIISLSFCILSSAPLSAQYFSNRYVLFGGTSNGYISSLQILNDTIYAMCQVTDTVPPYKNIGMWDKFDKQGNIISRTKFDIPARSNIGTNHNTLIKTNDGGLAYGGWTWGSTQTLNSILLIKYDSHGDYKWYKEITDTNYLSFYCAAVVQDSFSNYYFTGIVEQKVTQNIDIYIAKSDSLGNLIYMHVFSDPLLNDDAIGLCINRNGNIVISGAGAKDQLYYNDIVVRSKIYILDTSGSVINYILGVDTNRFEEGSIIAIENGGYLMATNYICYND